METEANAIPDLPDANASPISEERTSAYDSQHQSRRESSRVSRMNDVDGEEEDLSHQCEFVAGPPPWTGKKTSAIWNYFSHLDMKVHPDMQFWRLCNICRRRGVDKAVNVTESASTGKLIDHLKRNHHDEYLQFQLEKEEKLKERAVNREAVGGPAKLYSPGSALGMRKRMKIDRDSAGPRGSRIVQVGGFSKTSDERMQEELHRLLEIQKIAEKRLDEISDRLEGGENLSPFDMAMLQDRKESAVKNVQAVGRKVDALCDKLNNQAVYV